MLRKWLCQADVTIVIEPVDPILVKSGHATMDGADMAPVSTLRDGRRIHYLPGPSLKGVLRSHLERIARTLRPGSVCLPYYDPDPRRGISVPVSAERRSYGCGFRSPSRGRTDTAPAAYANSCAACRLFGSMKFGGRFSIGDAYPLAEHEPKPETRNGVGIDRFTGGTVGSVLFDLQVLVDGKFKASIRLTNFEFWQLAVLHLLLTDLADEMIAVGSGRSRGLGRVRATVESFRLTYTGVANSLLGIGQIATPEEQEAYGLHNWMPDRPVALPSAPRIRGLRQEYDLDTCWSERLQALVPAFDNFLQWHGGPQGEVSRGERDNA